MEGAHHRLELGDLFAALPVGGVLVVRSEEGDRVVAPVVGEALLEEVGVVHELVHREQLHRRHPQIREVLDGGGVGQAAVGAAQALGDAGVTGREPLDVDLIDDRLVQWAVGASVRRPVEERVVDDGLGTVRCAVVVVALVLGADLVGEGGGVGVEQALDGLGVRVEEELGGVGPAPGSGLPWAMDAEAVALARCH